MPADWLPGETPAPDLSAFPAWEPKVVREQLVVDENWDELTYLVVDELQEGIAGIVATPWPRLDKQGRLRFADEDEATQFAVSVAALRTILAEQRLPIVPVPTDEATDEDLRTRRVSIGDVFAARVRPPGGGGRRRRGGGGGGGGGGGRQEEPVDLDTWVDGRLLDITAEAREVAKIQTSAAAVKGVISPDFLELIFDEFREDEGPSEPEPDGTDPQHGPDRDSPAGGEAAESEVTSAEGELKRATRRDSEQATSRDDEDEGQLVRAGA